MVKRIVLHLGFLYLALTGIGVRAVGQSCDTYVARADEYSGIGNYREARTAFVQAEDCFQQQKDFSNYMICLSYEIDCLQKLSEYNALSDRIQYQREQLVRYSGALTTDEINSVRFSNQLFEALLLRKIGNVDDAIGIFQNELDSIARRPDDSLSQNDLFRRSKLQMYLSESVLQKGNFEQASAYAYEALDVNETTLNWLFSDGSALNPLIALAESQFTSGRRDEAWETMRYIEQVVGEITSRRNERQYQVLRAAFRFHLRSHQMDSAFTTLSQLKTLDTSNRHRAEIFRLTGEYHTESGDLARAENSYTSAVTLIRTQQGDKSEDMAAGYLALGDIAMRRGQVARALAYYHSGLYSLSDEAESQSVFENPLFGSLYSQRDLLEILQKKAIALNRYYEERGDPDYLEAAWKTTGLARKLMHELRTSYTADTDKSLLVNATYPIFEQALSIAFQKYNSTRQSSWIDTAFVLMEESKALNLRDAIQRGHARNYAGIPDSLLQLEQTLKFEIADKERLARELRSAGNTKTPELINLMQDITTRKEQYHGLLSRFEKEHPRYYALLHQSALTHLADMRMALQPAQTLLEYFVGDSVVFLVRIHASGQSLYRIPKDFPLEEMIASYHESMLAFADSKSPEPLQAYISIAVDLCRRLIPDEVQGDSSLLIIPDGILGYLSFSSLLQSAPESQTNLRALDYFLWHHDVSYAYSANLYNELRKGVPSHLHDILICAPEFDNLPGIPPLRNNAREAHAICDITGGVLLEGKACTASDVLSKLRAQQFNILHLATHGSANDLEGDESFLVFSGDERTAFLHAYDLYNYDLPLDLVYLSACETGTGELRRGEGLISLSRAFFYAGVKSLVTTLWNVEDTRSMELAQLFYAHLKAGETKDAALSDAQRAYLKALPPAQNVYAHPVYWSALIPVGNMDALDVPGSATVPFWVMVLSCVAALLVALLLIRRFFMRT